MYFRRLIHYFLYATWCSVYITTATDWHFEGVNIAYAKQAVQGPNTCYVTLSTGIKKYYTADLAVDGKTSGKFEDGSCTHTEGPSSSDAYWKVELQKAYYISGIIIYNMAGYEVRLKNFIIFGNETEVIHNSTGSNEYNQSVIQIPIDGKRTFSTIMIQLPANIGYSYRGMYFLTLCEVEIYAEMLCNVPKVTNGHFLNLSTSKFKIGTSLHFTCDPGFTPANSENNITCLKNKRWSGTPECKEMVCNAPNVRNGQFLNLLTSKFKIGTSLHFMCDPGFTPAKSENNINCLKNQRWSETPECKEIQDTLKAAAIVGISGAVLLEVIVITGLAGCLYRRRKRNLKQQEVFTTYTYLRKTHNGPINDDYAELNAMELENDCRLKDEESTRGENPVYCNAL